jgi:hypothetical protein
MNLIPTCSEASWLSAPANTNHLLVPAVAEAGPLREGHAPEPSLLRCPVPSGRRGSVQLARRRPASVDPRAHSETC